MITLSVSGGESVVYHLAASCSVQLFQHRHYQGNKRWQSLAVQGDAFLAHLKGKLQCQLRLFWYGVCRSRQTERVTSSGAMHTLHHTEAVHLEQWVA